ncbi:MAG TPA: phosphatidylglycerol lysyltransferase domain-containing protein, partial [Gemmatimonadaceae bacterium]|nr:phosphatidylglycerol lysyltransferase domain-containing protein [Gemmatimonadaceae bacterium]
YFGAGQRLEEQLSAKASWSRVLVGAQPVWNPQEWASRVKMKTSLRAQFNRARNKGVTVSEWTSKEAENHPALRWCLADWLDTRHLPTLHFLVEPETLARLHDRRVFVAALGDREVVGFTVLSPVSARNGWLVEQIVRGVRAPNGTAELLIDTAIRAVAATGATYATLGLSPLSERAKIPRIAQPMWLDLLLRWLRVHGRRFYNFDGLDAFKAKFNPETWEPIFAIADSENFPPRALYAIAGAFSGGNPVALVAKALLRAGKEELSNSRRKLIGRSAGAIPGHDRRPS